MTQNSMKDMPQYPKFYKDVTLYTNIQARLIILHSTLEDVARELQTTAATVRTIIGNRFQRNGKSTPLDKKVFEYFSNNMQGFEEYCKENNITVALDS